LTSASHVSLRTGAEACSTETMAAHPPSHEDLDIFQQMLAPMQLTAIGLHNWVSRGAICGIPIKQGALLVWMFLLLRGILAACEVLDVVDIIFVRDDYKGNPFAYVVHMMMLVGSVGDIMVSVCGFWASFDRRVLLALITVIWAFVHLFGGILFTVLVAWLDTMQMGSGRILIALAVFLVGVDCCVLLTSLQNFLATTLKRTVAPSAQQILSMADDIAAQCGSHVTNRNHIIAALLQDDISLQRLRRAGVDIDALNAELRGGSYLIGIEPNLHKSVSAKRVHFGSDAAQLMHEAAAEQWKAEDDRLTADHILLALCCHEGPLRDLPVAKLQSLARARRINLPGVDKDQLVATLRNAGVEDRIPQVVLTPSREMQAQQIAGFWHTTGTNIFLAPEASEMRAGIEETRLHNAVPHGPPPAKVFGCLPLEETVGVYIILQVLLCTISVCCLVFRGRGLGVVIRLRTVNEMRFVEFIQSVSGIHVGATALYGIERHRWARREVREAAYQKGVRWDAELDEAFDAVRNDEDAPLWLSWLKHAAKWLSLNLVWNGVQLVVEVPVFAMFLIYGNVCNSYTHAMNHITPGFAANGEAPMHCSDHDLLNIALMVSMALLQIYMSWCMLALWHQYAYGWTTTDMRGSAYLDPFGPMPDSFMRALMGLPRAAQRRLSGPEGKPIIL